MRVKTVLAAFLLGVGLCFVPALGYGEVITEKEHPTYFRFYLLKARLNYVMMNPNDFACVFADYDDLGGALREIHKLPERVETKGKVLITVYDRRGAFSYKSGVDLLEAFKQILVVFYSYLDVWVTDMNTDIVAKFVSEGSIPLGYFYQGECHLWEK